MAKLLVQDSSGVREFELVDNEVQIGRELDNALRLADPSVSRHHATVRKTPDGYEIQDLGSSNGVLLNGLKVQASPLRDGDRLTLGQIQVTFVDPRPVPSEPTNPLGTVRISPEEMRRVQAAQKAAMAGSAPAPEPAVPESGTSAPMPPPVAPSPVQPHTPPAAQAPGAPAWAPGGCSIPVFMQGWLPSVPDDAEPIMIGDAPERGDFLTRLVAHLIDMAPLVAIIVIFQILRFVGSMIPGVGCLFVLVQTILCLSYTCFFMPWCWSRFGATPGKKLMKLRIVPEDDPTGRIDLGTAYLRLLGHICNCTIGYLLILGAERKAVQDMISKSICIKVDR